MLKYGILLFSMMFAFGCTVRDIKVPDTHKKSVLTLEQFEEHWQVIVDRYVKPLSDTPEARLACFRKLIAIGLEECLGDRNSHYFSKEDAAKTQEGLEGFYAGIGLKLSDTDNPVTIASVIENSPAAKSGKFEVGDEIIEIDGQNVVEESTTFIAGKIRGAADTEVTLRVRRNATLLDAITLRREPVVISSVHAMDIGNDITYIKIDYFSLLTPSELVIEILKRLLVLVSDNIYTINFDAKKFVIDLRGDPGGSVQAVGMMSNMFAASKDDIVLTMQFREEEQTYLAEVFAVPFPVGIFRGMEMNLLIDGGSASASEIFAEFLHQTKDVARVGKRSYGKGSVQEIILLEHGDALHLTIAEYLVGKDKTRINKIGIQPEYEVDGGPVKDSSGKTFVDPINDPQLKKAIELLRQARR